MLTSLLNLPTREPWNSLIHSQTVLQLFPGLPRPLAEMKLEEDTTRCHRISIKRWTWLDPAAIARCGYSHSQQALQSFTTVTGASGLLDKLTQHISLPFN